MVRLLSWLGAQEQSSQKRKVKQASHNRKLAHLCCERLEDRTVPSTYIDQYTTPLECNEGQSLTLHAIRDEGDPPPQNVEWDFDYDGESFDADPSASGNLNPSHQFQSSGLIVVGLQVTETAGDPYFTAAAVYVVNVAPTATVTNSSPAPEASPVTFTVVDVIDPDPNDTFTYWADWYGTGDLEHISNDPGSPGLAHLYDDNGQYSAVIRVQDSDGDYTDYTQTVNVTNVGPNAGYFGPATTDPYFAIGSISSIMPGVPIRFHEVTDVSFTDAQAGFTFWLSTDGGTTYSSSASPNFYPTFIPGQTYELRGYVEDKDGGTSPIYSHTIVVYPAWTVIANSGTGDLLVSWAGGSGVLHTGEYGVLGGNVKTNLTFVTEDAQYAVATNGNFGIIGGVRVTSAEIRTDLVSNDLFGMTGSTAPGFADPYSVEFVGWMGNGSVDTITLVGGNENATSFSLYARGDLGDVSVATGIVSADWLQFEDLTGSIDGLKTIGTLRATGWLGDDSLDEVSIDAGVAFLSAYGIAGIVHTDLTALATNWGTMATVGYGGVAELLDIGNAFGISVNGNVNEIDVRRLWGDVFVGGDMELFEVVSAEENPLEDEKYPRIDVDGNVNTAAIEAGTVKSISVRNIKWLACLTSLTVIDDINSTKDIELIKILGGGFKVRNIIAGKKIKQITVTDGDFTVQDVLADDILSLEVQGAHNLTARKITVSALAGGMWTHVFAGKDLTVTDGIYGYRKPNDYWLVRLNVTAASGNLKTSIYWEGTIHDVEVGRDFIGFNKDWKVSAYSIDQIRAGGHIGGFLQNGEHVVGGMIETVLRKAKVPGFDDKFIMMGGNISEIHAGANYTEPPTYIGGSVMASRVHAEYGSINTVKATSLGNRGGTVSSLVTARKINLVQGFVVAGDVKIDVRLYVTTPAYGTPNNWSNYDGSIGSVKAVTLTSKIISGRLIGTIEVTGGQMEIGTNILFHAGLDATTGAVLAFGNSSYSNDATISVGYDAHRFLNTPKDARPTFGDGAKVLTMTAKGATAPRVITVQKVGPIPTINIKSLILKWDVGTGKVVKQGAYELIAASTELDVPWNVLQDGNAL